MLRIRNAAYPRVTTGRFPKLCFAPEVKLRERKDYLYAIRSKARPMLPSFLKKGVPQERQDRRLS